MAKKIPVPNRWSRHERDQAAGEVRALAACTLEAFGLSTPLNGLQDACILLKYLQPSGCDLALAAHRAAFGYVHGSLVKYGMVDPAAAELLRFLHDYIEDFSDWGYVDGSWLRLELGGLHAAQ